MQSIQPRSRATRVAAIALSALGLALGILRKRGHHSLSMPPY